MRTQPWETRSFADEMKGGTSCVRVRLAITKLKSHISIHFFSPPPRCHSAVFRAGPLLLKKQCGKPPVHWWKCCPHYGSSRGQAMAASIQPASNWLQNDQLPRRKGWGRRDLEKYGFYLIQLNHKKETSVPLMLHPHRMLSYPRW